MFVVYSPEGRRFIGEVNNLPSLKVDPIKRSNRAKQATLENMSLEPDHSSPYFQQDKALKQYQDVKEPNERKLIVKAFEVMSSPVITITSDASLYEAWALMQGHSIGHVPVVDNKVLIGIISKSDLLNRVILNADDEIEEVRSETVAQIMQGEVVTTEPDTDIREVAVALTKYQISALPVVNSNEVLLGIITLSGLVKRLSQPPPIELYT